MKVPAKELEYYRTKVSEEALQLLIDVMQSLFLSSNKATLNSIRNYLTLSDSDDFNILQPEDIEFFLRDYYRKSYKSAVPLDHPNAGELLKHDYVMPSDFTLKRTAKSQYNWIKDHYHHYPVEEVTDDAAIELFCENLFNNTYFVCPILPDRMRDYLFDKCIDEAFYETA